MLSRDKATSLAMYTTEHWPEMSLDKAIDKTLKDSVQCLAAMKKQTHNV